MGIRLDMILSALTVSAAACSAAALAQLPPAPVDTGAAQEKRPKLFVPQRTQDLGIVYEGDVQPVSWVLLNQGDADLVIDRATASCGCTIVALDDEQKRIPPGGRLELTAKFESTGRAGRQTKTVRVISNDPVEPTLDLQFIAQVDPLFVIKPPRGVHLRSVRRGETIDQTIDITPGPGQNVVDIVEMEITNGAPITYRTEALPTASGTGRRIHLAVANDAPLGKIRSHATIRLNIGGLERVRKVMFTGTIVGALTYAPQLIRTLDRPLPRGQRLTTITLRSTDREPFEVIGASAGPWLDVTVAPRESRRPGTEYTAAATIRDTAPDGPLAATLRIRTSLLDQPVVDIPIFVRVAPIIAVDPPLILLRQDGTRVGANRRVKLAAHPTVALGIGDIHCDQTAVTATVETASPLRKHIRFLKVRLSGVLPAGTYETVLTVATNVDGAGEIRIPVVIDAVTTP
ncbi:MAG: DUF1573 domain-containing protein [Phycisphaerae bacterium]